MNELGEEMKAEGWNAYCAEGGGGVLIWCHEPSHRAVSVMDWRRSQYVGPVWGPEPASPNADGYVVSFARRNEHGEPLAEDATACFWIESYTAALRHARALRASILADRYQPPAAVQLTLDDALPGGRS